MPLFIAAFTSLNDTNPTSLTFSSANYTFDRWSEKIPYTHVHIHREKNMHTERHKTERHTNREAYMQKDTFKVPRKESRLDTWADIVMNAQPVSLET